MDLYLHKSIRVMLRVKQIAAYFKTALHHSCLLTLTGKYMEVRAGSKILRNYQSVVDYSNSIILNDTSEQDRTIRPIPVKIEGVVRWTHRLLDNSIYMERKMRS